MLKTDKANVNSVPLMVKCLSAFAIEFEKLKPFPLYAYLIKKEIWSLHLKEWRCKQYRQPKRLLELACLWNGSLKLMITYNLQCIKSIFFIDIPILHFKCLSMECFKMSTKIIICFTEMTSVPSALI